MALWVCRLTNVSQWVYNKTKVYFDLESKYSKAMVFPVIMYGCESWTIKKVEDQRVDSFELWCWRLLRVPWTARRSNQSILEEINLEYSLEGLMLKLKLQYFRTRCKEPTHWKRPCCWERLRVGREGGDREWDGWMASLTQWTLVWANSGRWWRTGKPDLLKSWHDHDWTINNNVRERYGSGATALVTITTEGEKNWTWKLYYTWCHHAFSDVHHFSDFSVASFTRSLFDFLSLSHCYHTLEAKLSLREVQFLPDTEQGGQLSRAYVKP